MKLSPPLAVTGIIAASFAWMAWQNRNMKTATVYYGDVYWLCEDGSREPVIWDQPAKCPQWDGLDYGIPNGIPHERKMRTKVHELSRELGKYAIDEKATK